MCSDSPGADLLPGNLLQFNKCCILNAYCFITFFLSNKFSLSPPPSMHVFTNMCLGCYMESRQCCCFSARRGFSFGGLIENTWSHAGVFCCFHLLKAAPCSEAEAYKYHAVKPTRQMRSRPLPASARTWNRGSR